LAEERSAFESLASRTSRRGFLSRVGRALFLASAAGAAASAVRPGETEGYHLCGHTFTTGSCVHPLGDPRVDARGFPLRAGDGNPIDNLGRRVDRRGRPVDRDGTVLRDPDGNPLPPAPRTRICDETGRIYGFDGEMQGAWYRCCFGQVRKLWDCCAYSGTRINGDAALTGYCYSGRRVFCVTYYDTRIPC
jgi:hypothetical protein